MREVPSCPICKCEQRTQVCAHNGLIFNESLRSSELALYNYALCHECGLVYATRRPVQQEYKGLIDKFKTLLGKDEEADYVFEGQWSEEDRAELRRKLANGWLVSEERIAKRKKPRWLPMLRFDRTKNFFHFDLISSLMPLEGARILEFRTKTGFLLDALRRFFGAQVHAVPMTPRNRQIIEEAYGVECGECLNFEEIQIPFEGQFDLIIAKHMFTHALYPDRFFATLRERLRPGGAVYLYGENDDSVLFHKRKNLFAEQKCFHFQNFDVAALGRCLRRSGFEPALVCHPKPGYSEMACFARLGVETEPARLARGKAERRLEMYRRWHDSSALCLPDDVKSFLGAEYEALCRRALERGDAVLRRNRIVPLRRYRVSHAEGYEEVNAKHRTSTAAEPPGATSEPTPAATTGNRLRRWFASLRRSA